MKNVFLTILGVLAISFAASAQGKLEVNKVVHDFGKLSEGPVATYTFEVKNTGNAPIIMSNVQASCGCTTPEWKKEPIMPGAKSLIKVGYNTSGRPGAFNKTITITSNAENPREVLTIKGSVTPKAGGM